MSVKNAFGCALFVALALTAVQSQAALVNGGFELPSDSPGTANFSWRAQALIPGWRTTAADGLIEIWSDGFGGFASYQGTQHAEINATQVGNLYQDAPGIPAGVLVGFQFAHRGRYAVADVMELTLTDLGADNLPGGGDDTVLFTQQYSDARAWRFYTGSGILTLGNTVRFSFRSVSSGGGVPDGGNFIDAADFGFGIGGGGGGGSPASVPTLTEWGMILLSTLLAFGALFRLRRSRH